MKTFNLVDGKMVEMENTDSQVWGTTVPKLGEWVRREEVQELLAEIKLDR